MKVVLLSTELNKLEVVIDAIEFPNDPSVGDFVDISNFMDENQKDIFISYCQREGKSEFVYIKRRSWHLDKGEVVMYLHLEHLDH